MSDLFGQDRSRVLMPGQPITGADAPTSNPSVLAAMLNAGFAPQTAATRYSQDLADALAAMRDPAQGIRTPSPSVADRLADALMQRRYGQSMQGFRPPALSGLDPPSAGQPDAPAPAPNLIHDAPEMQAGMTGGLQIDSAGELYPADLFAPTFDDPIPYQGAPWRPSSAGAGAVALGDTFGNMVAGQERQDSETSDFGRQWAAQCGAGKPIAPVVDPQILTDILAGRSFVDGLANGGLGPQDEAYVQSLNSTYPSGGSTALTGGAGSGQLRNVTVPNMSQDLSAPRPDSASDASSLGPSSSAGYLPATAAFAPFPIPTDLLSNNSVAAESGRPQLSSRVNSYLLPPGTPVNALGAAAPVELISPGSGNTTIDKYPSQSPALPEIPAPLLTRGASVQSQVDNYSQASYLVSAGGSSANYSPLTFLPGAIGIANANPGDTWAGTPLTADDIAAAKSFSEWALGPWVRNNPYLGAIWNGYGFVRQSGMDPAQQAFAARRAALDKQFGWMAVPALLPLAIGAAPTLLSAADTAGAWGGSQASVWAPRIVGGLGVGGAAALQQEEEYPSGEGRCLR